MTECAKHKQKEDGLHQKPLASIKHGQKVIDLVEDGNLYFVDDIRRGTGLDDKTLRTVLARLLKNKYIENNGRGQWSVKS